MHRTSEDAQGVLLMKRALARTGAELNGNRTRCPERAAALAGRLLDTASGGPQHPVAYDQDRSPAMPANPADLETMTYDEALAALIVNPDTTYFLRQPVREDEHRDTHQALRDAELLVGLLRAKARHEHAKQADAGQGSAAPARRDDENQGG